MKSVATIVTVLVFSLGIWVYFYEIDMPLTSRDTAVVVGICLAAVLATRWIWAKLRRKRGKKEKIAKGAKTLATALAAYLCSSGLGGNDRIWSQAGPNTEAPQPSQSIACSPESPVVPYDGSVVLRAWTADQRLAETSYKWTSTEGRIEGSGSEVRWIFEKVPSGLYHADLSVTGVSIAQTCSIRVVVMEPGRGEQKRESARTFLVPQQAEDTNYGLYSYVLFGSRPTETDRPRYLGLLQAYLNQINDLVRLGTYISHSKLNITYIPLETAAPDSADAAWLMAHYDYARARVLLDSLAGDRKDGIYLVSSLKPLSGNPGPPYLVQNLTTVPTDPPNLISWWMREFLNQASQERFWEPKTSEILALNLRTTVAVLATGLPDVQKSISSWIAWIH